MNDRAGQPECEAGGKGQGKLKSPTKAEIGCGKEQDGGNDPPEDAAGVSGEEGGVPGIVDAQPEEVLELIAKYNLIAVPVLDEADKMLGIVTVDDTLELFLPYAVKRKRHG